VKYNLCMKKEMMMEVGQKIVEIILVAFVVTSSFLLLKYLIVSILKIIAMYFILEILKFAKIL